MFPRPTAPSHIAGAMKLTNSHDLAYLEKTTRDRIVRAALAIENTTPEGGILVILQMRDLDMGQDPRLGQNPAGHQPVTSD